jgi:Carboxylesterase family
MSSIGRVGFLRQTMAIAAVLIYGASGARNAVAAEALRKPACTAPSVITTAGKFCGVTQDVTSAGKKVPVRAYLGMRYGFAQRFAASKPVTATGQVRATLLGNVCPQADLPANAPVSEDCLFLNV